MPWARAAKAPWEEVCESPHTMVMPGRVAPCSRPHHVDDPLAHIPNVELRHPVAAAVLVQRDHLLLSDGVLDAGDAGSAVVRWDVVVRRG